MTERSSRAAPPGGVWLRRRPWHTPLPARSIGLAWRRDAYNRVRFGPSAPRYAERIWVDPAACTTVLESPGFYRRQSARVVTGSWPHHEEHPVREHGAVRASMRRWLEGCSWESSGELERMARLLAQGNLSDGLLDAGDVRRRCDELDRMYDQILREGRLRIRQELDPHGFRELDGVGVHVGPGGALIKAGGGFHRFAIALILGIPVIPAQIGVVHVSGLARLAELRRAPVTGDR